MAVVGGVTACGSVRQIPDAVDLAAADPRTHVILLYLESFGNARTFGRLARHVGRVKPIVTIKAGRSSAGARAAASHTGALAASDVLADGLFRQAGIVRVDTLAEMFGVAALLEHQPLPAGPRLGGWRRAARRDHRNETSGPVLLCSLGGTLVELSGEPLARLLPLMDTDIDEPALRDLLARVPWLASSFPEILEMDLNPVRLLQSRLAVVDARIRVGHPPRPAPSRGVAY